ncbi:MAG: NTP transferase domain-containing protein [Sphingomonadaceae bacterium]
MAADKIVGALIAAGAGTRFGGSKLEAMLDGAMLGTYAAGALRAAPVSHWIAIVRADTHALNEWLAGRGYRLIINDTPAAGLSHSVALAAQTAMSHGANGLLIALADMPFVPVDYFARLVADFAQRTPRQAVTSATGEAVMPPAMFPRSLFESLMRSTGDSGGRQIIQGAARISVDSAWLVDIDTHDDLTRAATRTSPK